ncbi:hypothetical protein BJ684DRAFT_21583, partial [Piptocephalis cylindrospora]
MGAGPVGLLVAAVAKVYGAIRVFMVDVHPQRLAFAKSYINDGVMDATDFTNTLEHPLSPESDSIRNFDVVIECSGVESSLQASIKACRPGGAVVPVGMAHANITLPLIDAMCKEVDIRGVFRYRNTY